MIMTPENMNWAKSLLTQTLFSSNSTSLYLIFAAFEILNLS